MDQRSGPSDWGNLLVFLIVIGVLGVGAYQAALALNAPGSGSSILLEMLQRIGSR